MDVGRLEHHGLGRLGGADRLGDGVAVGVGRAPAPAVYHSGVPGDVTRRDFLARSAAAVLAAGGLYELVDGIAAPTRAAAATAQVPPEQHLLLEVPVITDNGVEVLVPPLHHQLVTAKLRVGKGKAALLDAQRELERALQAIDRSFAPTPAGLGLVVAWGLPYFAPLRRGAVGEPCAARPPRERAGAARRDPVPERPGLRDPRAERRGRALPQRQPRAHRAGRTRDLRPPPRPVRDHEHPQGLRRRRLRREAEPPEADGAEGRDPRRAPHPGQRAALPRLHLDAAERARARRDREPRDAARAHRPVARRLLLQRHDDARLAPLPRRRAVVPGVRLRRADLGRVPAGADHPGHRRARCPRAWPR